MDNLTHSLIGAVLGQAGLKRKSGLAMPTLIIAANIPDIDGACMALGTVSLAMRRGITHGPIAMLVLPALLTWGMVAFDKWQARRGTRPEGRPLVAPGWLFALALIGCLSHPLFDWMNSYGVRLLEPFSHRWFYGDALFIVDPWLLAMLIAGVWLSRRKEKNALPRWTVPALTVIVGVVGFLLLNLAITRQAEVRARSDLTNSAKFRDPAGNDLIVVANPVAFRFWRRDILWREPNLYGIGSYDAFRDTSAMESSDRPPMVCDGDLETCPTIRYRIPRLIRHDTMATLLRIRPHAMLDPRVRAFLFWSRMPIVDPAEGKWLLRDQRFLGRAAGNFSVELDLE